MKAMIKATGEIVEVSCILTKKLEETLVGNKFLEFTPDEIEILSDRTSDIDFEQRRFELVKAALQGFLSFGADTKYSSKLIAQMSIFQAEAVLKEYRKGGDE